MKRKGFTLVELLVVIAIIALLMGVLMPALARVRQIAYRMVCGTNLSGLGKAMLIYANDNEEEYAIAGGRQARMWSTENTITDWDMVVPPIRPWGNPNRTLATVTSSLYLLVKYADVTPKQFICKGDVGARIFNLADHQASTPTGFELTDAWDFGGEIGDPPAEHCSYSYHMPYDRGTNLRGYPVSAISNPGCPIASDRNPFLDRNAAPYLNLRDPVPVDQVAHPTCTPANGFIDMDKKLNAAAHQREGQNVLYNDSHVSFEKLSIAGIESDNIWKYWTTATGVEPEPCQRMLGSSYSDGAPRGNADPSEAHPMRDDDAFLISQDNRPPSQ